MLHLDSIVESHEIIGTLQIRILIRPGSIQLGLKLSLRLRLRLSLRLVDITVVQGSRSLLITGEVIGGGIGVFGGGVGGVGVGVGVGGGVIIEMFVYIYEIESCGVGADGEGVEVGEEGGDLHDV